MNARFCYETEVELSKHIENHAMDVQAQNRLNAQNAI